MPGSIDEVSAAIGELTATVKIVLSNQERRQDIDAAFRREMRSALKLLAPAAELAAVKAMAEHTKSRVDRARWTLSGVAFTLSALGYTVADKVREFFPADGAGHH